MSNCKHKVRDFIIWLIVISGMAFLYRRHRVQKGPLVRVLCFHDVPDRAWFGMVMVMLSEQYCVISPEQFYAKDFDAKQINILLTFDDGYQSWIDVVLPVLQQCDAKGLFFITSGLLDAAEGSEEVVAHFVHDRLHLTTMRQILTWDGVKALVAAGHTIGGHTVTHPNLAQLEKEEAAREIRADKQATENKLDVITKDFAYPFGTTAHFTKQIQELCQKQGYSRVYSAISGFSAGEDEDVPRTLVEAGQSRHSLKRWIEGGYDIFVGIAHGIRKTSR